MKAWMIAIAGSLMLLVLGGWYVASPWVTLYNIKAAVEHRDVEALVGYVDFDALRTNLKDQVHAVAAGQKRQRERANTSGWSTPDPMAAQVAMMDRQIDTYITADMLRMAAGKATPVRPGEAGDVGRMATDIAIDREGMGTFVVRGKTDTSGIGVVFSSHGLGWKLSGIRLPLGGTAPDAMNRILAFQGL